MIEINFEPIIEYIDTKVDGLREELLLKMAAKDDIAKILNAIDAFAKQSKEQDEDINVLEHKTERIEKWVVIAAEKTNVPYNR